MDTRQPKVSDSTRDFALTGNWLEATDKLKLFQNDLAISRNTALADLVEADFTGYAAKTLTETWLHLVDEADRYTLVYPSLLTFAQTGVTIVNAIYGWYVTKGDGSTLKMVSRFETPKSFDVTGTTLILKAMLELLAYGQEDAELFS